MREPFERVVHDHGATVLRVCRAVLGPGPDADDAWSETFLAALTAWPGLGEVTNMEAWLVRVAHHKAIDITRARARRALPSAALPDEVSTIGAPGADADGDELWAEVARLPERQRLAIAYHWFGGLSHAETAELIGGSPVAVRRAASDGLRALRRRYEAGDAREGEAR
ncbi:RNA polymerase sigma factor [Raineyella fluvialis]|uniref:Sigma-70 family RNA polymerase sigma factor n=1 Tax=Raineyella fluvialis TaxID=2662261 RepID=A0A5Q2FAR2_9ACTN|nr:sigma-70 family RNA polymerase sigma factor [Raineyella fluvialis]QGF24080.1 sigma-70 family RNA polymerase sigma factor [Raineyella fluvialis]